MYLCRIDSGFNWLQVFPQVSACKDRTETRVLELYLCMSGVPSCHFGAPGWMGRTGVFSVADIPARFIPTPVRGLSQLHCISRRLCVYKDSGQMPRASTRRHANVERSRIGTGRLPCAGNAVAWPQRNPTTRSICRYNSCINIKDTI